MQRYPLKVLSGSVNEARSAERLGQRSNSEDPYLAEMMNGSKSKSAPKKVERSAKSREAPNAAIFAKKVVVRAEGQRSLPLDGVVDLGAAISVIPIALVQAWKLTPHIRKGAYKGFDGRSKEYDLYWVEIDIPDVTPRLICVPATDRNDVLIGRDILENCRLEYNGPAGYFTLYEVSFFGKMVGRATYLLNRLRDCIARWRKR
jgi:hypothetical protein